MLGVMMASKQAAHAEKKKALLEKKGVKPGPASGPGLTRASSDLPSPALELVADLPKIIEDSKATLHAEEQAALPKKRGRPTGWRKPEAEPVSPPPPVTPAEPEALGVAPMISDALSMYYNQKADETGFEGYRIMPEKADLLAMQADQVAAQYFPQLSEKSSVLVVAMLTWGMHVLGTEMSYRRFASQKKAKEAPKPEEIEKKLQTEKSLPAVSAESFFTSPRGL